MIKDRCCARPVVRRYIPFSPPTRKKKAKHLAAQACLLRITFTRLFDYEPPPPPTRSASRRLVALWNSTTCIYEFFFSFFFLYIIFVGHLLTDLLFILTFFRFNEEEEEEEAPGLYLWPSRAAGCQVASLSLSFFLSLSRWCDGRLGSFN